MEKTRIEWLDVAKGIVIMLMILGHSDIPRCVSNVIFAFHMPFFFLASGLTTYFEKTSFERFCWNKLNTLGLPFLIYSTINLILWPIAKGKLIPDFFVDFLAVGWKGVALWFVPVLFFALILARIVYFVERKEIRYVITLMLSIISVLFHYYNITLPWNLSVVPFAAFFILVGDFCKQYLLPLSTLCWKKWFWYAISLVIFVSLSQVWRMDMAWNNVAPMIPKIIAAMCGCYCIVKASVVIVEKIPHLSKMIQAVGKETYVILAFSQIIIFYTNVFLKIGIIPKCTLLVVGLVLISYMKNHVVRIVKQK